MLFGKGGYYDRGEETPGFIDKLEGVAKIAGIVGGAVLARKPIARMAGRAAVAYAKASQTDLAATLGRDFASAGRHLFARQGRVLSEGMDAIQTRIASQVLHHKRVQTNFLGEIAKEEFQVGSSRVSFVHAADLGRFQSQETRERAAAALHRVSQARKVGEASDDILSARGRQRLGQAFGDIRFYDQHAGQYVKFGELGDASSISVVQKALAKATSDRATRPLIQSLVDNPENRNLLADELIAASRLEARRDALAEGLAHHGDVRHITYGDLEAEDGFLRSKVNEYADRIGMRRDPHSAGRDFVDEMMAPYRRGKVQLFGKGRSAGRGAVYQDVEGKLDAAFGASRTGLVLTGDNQVVSLAYLRSQREHVAMKALDELQLPLLPGVMNVPLKMFNFMRPATEIVKNVGRIAANPELRRMGAMQGMGASAEGFGLGESLIAIDLENGQIKKVGEGMRMLAYKRRDSAKIGRHLSVRSADAAEEIETLQQLYRSALKGDEHATSTVTQAIHSLAPKLSSLQYVPGQGMQVVAKDPAYAPLLQHVYGKDGAVGMHRLNPVQLMEHISDPAARAAMDPRHLAEATQYVSTEASRIRADIAPSLRRMASGLGRDLDFGMEDGDLGRLVELLAQETDQPERVLQHLDASGFMGRMGWTKLNRSATEQMFKSVTQAAQDRDGLLQAGVTDGGWRSKLKEGVLGVEGVPEAMQDLQEGVLAEIVKAKGLGDVGRRIGSTDVRSDLLDLGELMSHPSTARNEAAVRANPLGNFLRDEGMELEHIASYTRGLIRKGTAGQDNAVKEAELASLAAMGLDVEGLMAHAQDTATGAKIFDIARRNLSEIDHILGTPAYSNRRMEEMMPASRVQEAVRERFQHRPFHPDLDDLDLAQGSNYLVLPSHAPSLMDALEDPMAAANRILTGGGGSQFVRSLWDKDSPMGPMGMFANAMAQAPQDLANAFGLGLSAADRQTPAHTLANFIGKRVLPLYLGYEGYKMVNHNLHALGLPGLDDMGANLLANANLGMAGLKDSVGFTQTAQGAVGMLPGLDLYFSPRSKDEYEDYLFFGDEDVREQRMWLVGSRNPLHGGAVKHYRPNFYRRWKSHWTEADNVDLSNARYSWIPNLENPLAPVFRLLNPGWWENKHAADRPYPGNPYAALAQERMSLGMGEDGTGYTLTNAVPQGDAIALARFGGSLPALMQGGPMSAGGTGPGHGGGHGGGGAGGGGGEGWGTDPIWLQLRKTPTEDLLRPDVGLNALANGAAAMRQHTGLYGAFFQMLPGWPQQPMGVEAQDPGAAHSFRRSMWMNEYGEATGPMGEFFRRFIAPETQAYDAHNPLPNNMPTWLPGKFRTGDPYMRTPGIGELNLPGDAYERTHPFISPLRVRASSVGHTVEEIMEQWVHPVEDRQDKYLEDITDFGTEVHLQTQRKLFGSGTLLGSEVPIYSKEHNISGTVDALVRGVTGVEVVDMKTQGGRMFANDEVPEKYIDQITFYMGHLGLKRGHLAFINRDDLQQVRIRSFDFDPVRFDAIMARIEEARSRMRDLQARGAISPFETYDLVSRIEILARVAPESREYREAVEAAQGGAINAWEQPRLTKAMEQAKELRKQYNLYPRRFGVGLETKQLYVEGVTDAGEIVTEMGTLRLAGLKFKPHAFAQHSAQEILGKLGVEAGRGVDVTLLAGGFNAEVMNDVTTTAIVGGLNKRLIAGGYADEDQSDRSPLSSKVVYGDPVVGRIWEWLAHADNMFTNKFLRVRSGLEQFERGEVFGTDRSKWNDIYGNFVEPTVSSFVGKDPVSAAVQSGVVASLFVRKRATKGKVFAVAAAVGGGISLARGMWERLSGETWTPGRYRKQAEFDEYWDTLEYMKWVRVAESAKGEAIAREGIDVDELAAGNERTEVPIGPYAAMAIDAERRARRTMFGYDELNGSLQDALAALPRRQQQIAEEIALSGTLREKERFYELLPEAQQRVLGRFLGAAGEIPERPNLTEYFSNHFLPDADWAGWDTGVDMDDLRTRSASLEGTRVEAPSRAKVEKSRAYTQDTAIPRMDHPTAGDVRARIEDIVEGFPGIRADFRYLPAESSEINLELDLHHDQTAELTQEMRRDSSKP